MLNLCFVNSNSDSTSESLFFILDRVMTSSTQSPPPLREKLALAVVPLFRELGEELLLSITQSSLSSITTDKETYVDKAYQGHNFIYNNMRTFIVIVSLFAKIFTTTYYFSLPVINTIPSLLVFILRISTITHKKLGGCKHNIFGTSKSWSPIS